MPDIMLKQPVESVPGRPAEVTSCQRTFAVIGIDDGTKTVLFVVCKVSVIHVAMWPLLPANAMLAISYPLPDVRGSIRMRVFASEVLQIMTEFPFIHIAIVQSKSTVSVSKPALPLPIIFPIVELKLAAAVHKHGDVAGEIVAVDAAELCGRVVLRMMRRIDAAVKPCSASLQIESALAAPTK